MEEDRIYYQEAQAALRNYDQKLWLIPGLFFVAVGFILENIMLSSKGLLQNTIILFIGSLFLLILILLNNKAHIFHISIQKKINEFDEKYNKENLDKNKIERIPLTSMTSKKFELRLNSLERDFLESGGEKGAKFDFTQKSLAKVTVSWWIRWIMIIIFLITAISFISCLGLTLNFLIQ